MVIDAYFTGNHVAKLSYFRNLRRECIDNGTWAFMKTMLAKSLMRPSRRQYNLEFGTSLISLLKTQESDLARVSGNFERNICPAMATECRYLRRPEVRPSLPCLVLDDLISRMAQAPARKHDFMRRSA
ncbi:11317_t:CDS:2 [Ambispora gerdemannii]|uniref:11317_t:CDS:1 n=1 Tax=Ambispora gerdemannii TaxID=144530 RepID=A0A9N8W2J8_9GLOM|nr:11317_t:CDS:2 [Ambispora gerdemannii]